MRLNDPLGTVMLESHSWGGSNVPLFSFVTPIWTDSKWKGQERILFSHATVDPALSDRKSAKPIVHHVTIVLNDSGSHMAECHGLGFVLTFKVTIDKDRVARALDIFVHEGQLSSCQSVRPGVSAE